MPQANGVGMNDETQDFTEILTESEQIINQCLDQYKLDELFVSFNGGKDCTVMLDILIDRLKHKFKRDDVAKDLKVVYIRTNSPFVELEDFVKQVEKHYRLKLIVTEGEMKARLESILEQDKRLKACFMGVRRTDPYCKDMKFMQQTDASWPQVLRVSPLLNWTYHQIWSYVHSRNVPYCSLYDKGYTSIGSTLNTRPNPSLAYEDSKGNISYLPAWDLKDESLERAGRDTNIVRTDEKNNCNGLAKKN